jgi:hypothetical protein
MINLTLKIDDRNINFTYSIINKKNNLFCFFYTSTIFISETEILHIENYISKKNSNKLLLIEYIIANKNSLILHSITDSVINIEYLNEKWKINDFEIINSLFSDVPEIAIYEYIMADEYDSVLNLITSFNKEKIKKHLEKKMYILEIIKNNDFKYLKLLFKNLDLNLYILDGQYMKVALINNRHEIVNYFIENNFDFKKVILSEEIFVLLNNLNNNTINLLFSYNNFVDFFNTNIIEAKEKISDFNKFNSILNFNNF